MNGIFINFRDQDEPGFAALLHRELSQRFGAREIFYASATIRPGDDFEFRLLEGVRHAQVLLAVIGSRWLTASHLGAGRAIDSPTDWVRREIAAAFTNNVCVIPVLINETERLTHAVLPDDINRLTKCQYVRLRHDNLEYDLARIVVEAAAHLKTPA